MIPTIRIFWIKARVCAQRFNFSILLQGKINREGCLPVPLYVVCWWGVEGGESKKSSGAPVDRPQTWMPVKDVREMIVRCPLESERFCESIQSLHQYNPATQPVREIYKGKENLLCTYMCMFTHTRRSFKFS